MNNKHRSSDKYAASRALLELDKQREADDWLGDTACFPMLDPDALELTTTGTFPKLPALVRRQAE